MLRKEESGCRKVEENDDIFITTTTVVEDEGVIRKSLLSRFVEPDLIGAIILNDTENVLNLQGVDDQISVMRVGKRKRVVPQS